MAAFAKQVQAVAFIQVDDVCAITTFHVMSHIWFFPSIMEVSVKLSCSYHLDMASYSLVKSYADKHGTTYPHMPWEPKKSFKTVADYFAKQIVEVVNEPPAS